MHRPLRRLWRSYIQRPPEGIHYDDLADEVVRLRLRRYAIGSDYVGELPCWFFVIERKIDGCDVGLCDLRVGWREEIAYAGHVGYRVYNNFRGHHYAYYATSLLLAFAYRLDMAELLITCDPDNIPSRRTLERLNGRYNGVVQVAKDTPAWRAGNREKCQFTYETEKFAFVSDLNKK